VGITPALLATALLAEIARAIRQAGGARVRPLAAVVTIPYAREDGAPAPTIAAGMDRPLAATSLLAAMAVERAPVRFDRRSLHGLPDERIGQITLGIRFDHDPTPPPRTSTDDPAMATLDEVLGSVLRDVAQARVQADEFTRRACLAYRDDPVMRLLPVPRVEIREATIELAFAIDQVRQDPVDAAAVARESARAELPNFKARLGSIHVRPRRGLAAQAIADLTGDAFQQALDDRLEALAKTLGPTVAADPSKLADEIARGLKAALLDALKADQPTAVLPAEATARLDAEAASFGRALADKIGVAIDARRAAGMTLGLAATHQSLADVPEKALARIRLTVAVENYEWVAGEPDDEGRPTDRLLLR